MRYVLVRAHQEGLLDSLLDRDPCSNGSIHGVKSVLGVRVSWRSTGSVR